MTNRTAIGWIGLAAWALVAPGVAAQDKAPVADQEKVDRAIEKGVTFLKQNRARFPAWDHGPNRMRMDELVLLTFVHAKEPATDAWVQDLLKATLGARLERTYLVSLHAMALQAIDAPAHQLRIQACAQFLVDNQCKNGQWSYGEPSLVADDLAAEAAKAPAVGPDRKTLPELKVKATRTGPDTGDHSNSQVAILGLRACHDAGIVIPKETLVNAKREWEQAQKKDGGWCYGVLVQGDHAGHPSYGTMTAGGVSSLVILRHLLKEDWKSASSVKAGLKWMADRFTPAEHPGPSEMHPHAMRDYYYYLYAVERACSLSATKSLGKQAWYAEGARRLLERQNENGSWLSPDAGNPIWDTCFAILFLKRATRPVETESAGSLRDK